MYAVIRTGGKQQKVQAGDLIEVELTHGDPGDSVEFQPLLVVDDEGKAHFGKDVGKAVVVAKLVGEQKGDKVKVFKYRPKSGYSRRQGHRQLMTVLEIEDVRLERRRPAPKKAEAAEKAEAKEPKATAEPEKPEKEKAAAAKKPSAGTRTRRSAKVSAEEQETAAE